MEAGEASLLRTRQSDDWNARIRFAPLKATLGNELPTCGCENGGQAHKMSVSISIKRNKSVKEDKNGERLEAGEKNSPGYKANRSAN